MKKDVFDPAAPILGVAVDQGSGLAAALREARGAEARADDPLTFKRIVVEGLSPHASTVLVDAHYGRDLMPAYAEGCVRMLAFEADVYEMSDDDLITRLPANLEVTDYPGLGAEVLKFFLYYAPNDPAPLNARKQEIVADIGQRCKEAGVTFVFEPLVYDRSLPDGTSEAFARIKPDLVRRATQTFADPRFGVDILKVEFPVNFNFVEGFGSPVMSKGQAEQAFVAAAEAAGGLPLLYLSAGVTFAQFRDALAFSRSAGVQARGIMCGRAIWSDAVQIFGAEGPVGMERWIKSVGCDRLSAFKEVLG